MDLRFNGFGGKVDVGETPLEAAIRELEVILFTIIDVFPPHVSVL